MKKKINLGLTIWLYIFIIATIGMIIFLICFPLISEKHIPIAEKIIGIVAVIILAIVWFLLDQGINTSIKISDDKIALNTVFEKRIYYKKDISILYAIHEHRGRGAYECPCLVIGCWYDNRLCYTKRKFVYNNYFLVLLDYKKLQKILSWYEGKIKLPPKQEFEQFKSKNVKKFYEIIKQHNYNTILLRNGREKENDSI